MFGYRGLSTQDLSGCAAGGKSEERVVLYGVVSGLTGIRIRTISPRDGEETRCGPIKDILFLGDGLLNRGAHLLAEQIVAFGVEMHVLRVLQPSRGTA